MNSSPSSTKATHYMMKKYLSLVALCLLLLASCGDKKKETGPQNQYLRPVTLDLSSKDTVQIRQLVDNYVQAFSDNNFEAASQMLYRVENDSIKPLTDKEREDFVKAMKHFTIYACELSEFTIRTEKNNEMKLKVQIIENGDLENNIGVTHFSLNPVLKDGTWYLTVRDKDAEGVENYYENN